MARYLAIAAIVIGALGALTEIVSFTMDRGGFLVRTGRDLIARVALRQEPEATATTAEACEQEVEKNLFVQRLCKDKEDHKARTRP